MNSSFKRFLVILLAITIGGSAMADEDDSPGRLLLGKAVYDGKRYAKLYPGSLFDADNTPGVFRLGLVWDERYDDEIKMIITFPITGEVSMEDLKKSGATFEIKIDAETEKPERVRDSIILRQKTKVFSKEYEAEISYLGSRKLLDKILAAGKVEFYMKAPGKTYRSMLKVTDKERVHYHEAEYTAINGLKRFHKGVWGD